MANHYGVLIPRVQPPDGALTIPGSDWQPLTDLVGSKLGGRVEIQHDDHLRVLLFGTIFMVPVYLARVYSDHALEDIAPVVDPELLRVTKTNTKPV